MVVSTLGALAIFALPAFGQYVMKHQDSVTWTEANEYCAGAYGTTLATIKDDADASTLLAMKQNLGNHHVWIGLNDIETDHEWVWASGYECDGECSALKWWNIGEPSGGIGDCAMIVAWATNIDTMFDDGPCAHHIIDYFACDKNPTEQPTTSPSSLAPSEEPTAGPTSPTSSPTKTPTKEPSPEPTADPVRDCDVLHIDEFLVDCSVEFEGHDNDIDSLKSDVTTLKDNLVNSTSAMAAAIQVLKNAVEESRWGQYVPVLEEKSWEDANEHCQSKYGTTLATIRSKLDAEAMMQMTQYYRYRTGGDSYPTDRWWIGLNDIERGGIDFKWASGYEGSWSSMLSWSNQDPCVHFAKGGEMTEPTIANGITLPDKFIYPYRCHFRWYFVCDAPLTFASDDLASAIASAATEIADADDFSDGLEPADSMVELNGTNMMIAGLVIANVVTMIVLAVVCCGDGSSNKHRYGAVGVASDSELVNMK